MDVYLAAVGDFGFRPFLKETVLNNKFHMLESIVYFQPWQLDWIKSKNCLSFMLDSGIFTFVYGSGGFDKIDVDKYITDYISFINDNKISLFFEMDLDSLVPLKKVEEFRYTIEQKTHKKTIPVWHHSRGQQYWEQMCEEYDYIAIGTDNKCDKVTNIPLYNSMTRYAHSKDCKVHMMGFSAIENIDKVLFDSVDSKTWKMGAITPKLYTFDGKRIVEQPKRIAVSLDYKERTKHNLLQWINYANYLKNKKNTKYYESLQMF
jgi:hypothetical protein